MAIPAITVKRADDAKDEFTVRANKTLFVEFAKTCERKHKTAITKAVKATEDARLPVNLPADQVAAFFTFVAAQP